MRRYQVLLAVMFFALVGGLQASNSSDFQSGDGSGASSTEEFLMMEEYSGSTWYNPENCQVSNTSGVHKNTILRWAKIFGHNTDQIPPNATITSATLKVHGYSGSYGVPIYAYKVLEAWNQNQLNQVSWSSRSVDWAGNTAWSVGGCGGNPSRGSTALGSDTYNTVKGSIEMSMGKTGRETTKMAKAARHGRQCRGIMSLHEIGAESFDRQ